MKCLRIVAIWWNKLLREFGVSGRIGPRVQKIAGLKESGFVGNQDGAGRNIRSRLRTVIMIIPCARITSWICWITRTHMVNSKYKNKFVIIFFEETSRFHYNTNWERPSHRRRTSTHCGQPFRKSRMLKIIGGTESKKYKWPWHVAILNRYYVGIPNRVNFNAW